MSLEAYVITGAVFVLLMAGILASHYRKVKQVDGTLLAAAVAFAIGIYFIVAIGIQTGRLAQAEDRLQARVTEVAPGVAAGLILPVLGEEGLALERRPFPWVGLIAVLVGIISVGLGVGASRRGDRSAGQTLLVLGIFLIVVAVVVFVALS